MEGAILRRSDTGQAKFLMMSGNSREILCERAILGDVTGGNQPAGVQNKVISSHRKRGNAIGYAELHEHFNLRRLGCFC